jgi:TonB family protein
MREWLPGLKTNGDIRTNRFSWRSSGGGEGGFMRLRGLFTAVLAMLLAATAGAQAPTVYAPGNGVSLPVVVKQVRAQYTQEARDQRIEGRVGLQCVVQADGTVTDVVVVQSLDSVFGLDAQAITAMRAWSSSPG